MPTIASAAIAPRPPKNERPRSATASAAHFFAAQRAARALPAAAPDNDASFYAQQQAWQHRVEQRVQAARDREEEQLAAARVPTSPPIRTYKPAPGLAHTSHEEIRQAAEAAAAVVPTAENAPENGRISRYW